MAIWMNNNSWQALLWAMLTRLLGGGILYPKIICLMMLLYVGGWSSCCKQNKQATVKQAQRCQEAAATTKCLVPRQSLLFLLHGGNCSKISRPWPFQSNDSVQILAWNAQRSKTTFTLYKGTANDTLAALNPQFSLTFFSCLVTHEYDYCSSLWTHICVTAVQ